MFDESIGKRSNKKLVPKKEVEFVPDLIGPPPDLMRRLYAQIWMKLHVL